MGHIPRHSTEIEWDMADIREEIKAFDSIPDGDICELYSVNEKYEAWDALMEWMDELQREFEEALQAESEYEQPFRHKSMYDFSVTGY